MISVTNATCQFIGEGRDTHFVKGQRYSLEIINTLFGKIKATPTRGYDMIPMSDLTQHYTSLHHFLHDWRIEELEHSYYGGGFKREIN